MFWVATAVLHSMVCFFVMYGALYEGVWNGGKLVGLEYFGSLIMTTVIIVVTVKVGIETM